MTGAPSSVNLTSALADGEGATGFPSSGLATTVPNLFFSRVLPQIESAEELVVSLYFFFAQGQKRRSPRYVTRRELEADATLARSLSRICRREDSESLSTGLMQATQRGTLLRKAVASGQHEEEIFVVNNPPNRRALQSVLAAGLTIEEPLPPADSSIAPNIFVLYEQNIGSITPLIAENLKEAEEIYPAEWIRDAFREAVELNKRSWRYIERILRRWEAEGRDNEEHERDTEGQWLARRYASGKRRGATGS